MRVDKKYLFFLCMGILIILLNFFIVYSKVNFFIGLDGWAHKAFIDKILIDGHLSFSHAFDGNYPSFITPNYHILVSIISLITSTDSINIIRYIGLLIWIFSFLMFFVLARQAFQKTNWIMCLIYSLIPTTFLAGGVLFPRSQIIGDFLILFLLYILFKNINRFNKNQGFLIMILVLSICMTHLFSGAFLIIPLTLFLIFVKQKEIKKKIIFICCGYLLFLVSFILPTFIKWGLPYKDRTYSILFSNLNQVNISLSNLITIWGIFIFVSGLFSITYCIFHRRDKKEIRSTEKFFLFWFLILFVLASLSYFNFYLLTNRILYLSLFPLMLIIAGFGEKIINKRYIFIFVLFILLITVQISNNLSFIPPRDNINLQEYLSFQNISVITDKDSIILSDPWTSYYVSSISKRNPYYITGFYSEEDKITKAFDVLINLDIQKAENIGVNYILFYKANTLNWVRIEKFKRDGNWMSIEELNKKLYDFTINNKKYVYYEDENIVLIKIR